jgi:hypothetical protein
VGTQTREKAFKTARSHTPSIYSFPRSAWECITEHIKGLNHGQKPLPLHTHRPTPLPYPNRPALDLHFHPARNRTNPLRLISTLDKPRPKSLRLRHSRKSSSPHRKSPQLDKDIARFKSFTARALITYLQENTVKIILDQLAFYKKAHKSDRELQLWQEGCHPELIQNEAMMRQKIEYIHHNPVKRGYVDMAEQWRYSSARNYAGREGLIPVNKAW